VPAALLVVRRRAESAALAALVALARAVHQKARPPLPLAMRMHTTHSLYAFLANFAKHL